jgi:feruloyl esterase
MSTGVAGNRASAPTLAARGLAATSFAVLAACSSSHNDTTATVAPQSAVSAPAVSPSIKPAMACRKLAAQLALPNTTIESVKLDRGGETNLTFPNAGPAPENCVVQGVIGAYTSAYTDPDTGSNAYGTHFELRMPTQWNGRFLYQGGGGGDGYVATADGVVLGAFVQTEPALWSGFAVVSSDGGHSSGKSEASLLYAGFGIDPTARVNYGYASIGQVTPVAKQIIAQYYAQQPAHSYFLGCSKGGQEAMQASQKYGDQFDGIVAGDPGFHLPHAAIAEAWNTQALADAVKTDHPDAIDKNGHPLLYKSFSRSDLGLLRKGVLKACDTLDGVADGMIFNTAACIGKFDPATLQCPGNKRASCLTAAQVAAAKKIFGGAKASDSSALYASFPYDTDMDGLMGWTIWDLGLPLGFNMAFNVTLAQEASAYVFTTPPTPDLDMFTVDMDQFAQAIAATSGDYTVPAVGFMDADSTNLDALKNHGGKIIYFHGASDPVFSMSDTIAYYDALSTAYGSDTANFARLFLVPGMNHCGGGAYTTDSFDALDAIVGWVENGQAPDTLTAQPSAPSASKLPEGTTRPLCAYPKYAHYKGRGSVKNAANFSCEDP